jgi:hypothetical protein
MFTVSINIGGVKWDFFLEYSAEALTGMPQIM